jgi:hypothetical protein
MKLECATRKAEDETMYTLVLDEDQVQAIASGHIPRVVKAMAEDVLRWADQDDAAAARPEPRKRCAWTLDEHDDSWDTACGNKFQFTDGGPIENDQKFCGYCGLKIRSRRPAPKTRKGKSAA